MTRKSPTLAAGAAVLAVDVGGTQVKAAVLDRAGRLTRVSRRPTPHSWADPGGVMLATVVDLLAELQSEADPIEAIGLAIPGIVDEASGRGVWSANLGWRDFGFRDRLVTSTGLVAVVAHDVRAAGEAEARLGAARGVADAVIVAIGTGIAAALRINGRAYTGHGHAGELGHVIIDPSGPPCACGKRGCLEAIASAAAIARRYQELSGHPSVGAAEVLDRVSLGDPIASQVWASAMSALGAGLGMLTSIMAPQVIVLGGGLAEAGAALFDPVRAELAARCSGLWIPPLVKAELGEDAGTWGAAILAREALTGTAG